jgi:hypothetical protein
MASEDSGRPIGSPIPATTVHPYGQGQQALEPLLVKVLAMLHCPDDLSEGFEFQTLLTEDGVTLEERDDVTDQMHSAPHHVDE